MTTIFQFSKDAKIKEWQVINDGVMGGVSSSSMTITEAGHGRFSGHVSLDNNGGFASVRYNFTLNEVRKKSHIVLRIKGDGKSYEFRLKSNLGQAESYVHPFQTSGEWETVRLKISDFYPQFRGRKLQLSNFNFDLIKQISFLIANKQEENFELLVDWIGIE